MNDELLVSYLLLEGDSSEREKVEQWIIENADNRKYFDHFKLIWETSHQLVLPTTINENEAWQRFKKRTAEPAQQAVVRRMNSSGKFLKIAATILICATMLAAGYFAWDATSMTKVRIASVDVPEIRSLPDGSVVTLNKNSAITYTRKLKGDARTVHLEGEAFFNVRPDKKKPFIVNVNEVTVTVVGTSFNVKENRNNTEIIVETGLVKVERNKKVILLHPGEKLVIPKKDSKLSAEKSIDKLYNYYRSKEFVCDNTPLWKLAEVLNEAYGVKIIIADPALRNLPLTTTFSDEKLENILMVISETFNITVKRDGDKIILN